MVLTFEKTRERGLQGRYRQTSRGWKGRRLTVFHMPAGPFMFMFFVLFFSGDVAFFEYFCTVAVFSLYRREYCMSFVFSLPGLVFLPCDPWTGYLTSASDSIKNQSKYIRYHPWSSGDRKNK